MDRIRKALDLARLERASPAELRRDDRKEAPESSAEPPPKGLPAAISYTRTRVFTPSPDVLESNRILNPRSADSASVAFRMLRTQVLQRMDANNWRTLAIFSPGAEDGKTTTAINLAISLASEPAAHGAAGRFRFQTADHRIAAGARAGIRRRRCNEGCGRGGRLPVSPGGVRSARPDAGPRHAR